MKIVWAVAAVASTAIASAVAAQPAATAACVPPDYAPANAGLCRPAAGRYADLLAALLGHDISPGWGLHHYDLSLTQGNVRDAELAGWKG